jgi:hypothetical protein
MSHICPQRLRRKRNITTGQAYLSGAGLPGEKAARPARCTERIVSSRVVRSVRDVQQHAAGSRNAMGGVLVLGSWALGEGGDSSS